MIATGPRAGVIGDPISHSKSPAIHGFWLRQLGLAGTYEAVKVAPDDLGAFVGRMRAEGWRGVNVTIPHKVAIMALADELSTVAARVGAVNTLYGGPDGTLIGHNTDIGGFSSGLPALAGPVACVLGSGGAARAVVAGLALMGCSPIRVVSRDPDKARALPAPVETFRWDQAAAALDGAHLLVNTTLLGMAGQPALRLDLAPLSRDAIVNDIVYVPLETALLQAAAARGLRTVDGLEMLIGQAAEAFSLFFGAAPDRRADAVLRQGLLA